MDFDKIFLKDACPTSIGGQAVMEGVMMRGPDRTAVSMRLPDGRIFIRTRKNGGRAGIYKIPLLRGIYSFLSSLVQGMSILTYSADVGEAFTDDDEEEDEPGRFEKWAMEKFGEKAIWIFLMAVSIVFALVVSIGVFILMPTVVISLLGRVIHSSLALNLIEGVFRLAIFVGYIALIARMPDIHRTFEYHGAEHKTIHCFENGLELNPENAAGFYRLHPRCGTSFLMFVMVISILLFSLTGWPNLWLRLLYRMMLIPVVAALSYEVLRWAGRSNNKVVEILSVPGLLLQKITTAEPDESELEIGICSMKAVLVDESEPEIEGICDKDAHLVEAMTLDQAREARADDTAKPSAGGASAPDDRGI